MQVQRYSLIETAKADGQEPYEYLNWVLTALPYALNQLKRYCCGILKKMNAFI